MKPECLLDMKKWDNVRIEWEDAEIGSHGWQTIDEIMEQFHDGTVHVQSMGFIIHFGENQLVLASTYDLTTQSVNGYIVIPYVNIRNAVKLKGI